MALRARVMVAIAHDPLSATAFPGPMAFVETGLKVRGYSGKISGEPSNVL